MQPFETIQIDSMIAACNGGGGPLGHPKVFLNLAADGRVECPYCSRLFVYRGHHAAPDGHAAETPSATHAHEARGADRPPPSAPVAAGTTASSANPAKP